MSSDREKKNDRRARERQAYRRRRNRGRDPLTHAHAHVGSVDPGPPGDLIELLPGRLACTPAIARLVLGMVALNRGEWMKLVPADVLAAHWPVCPCCEDTLQPPDDWRTATVHHLHLPFHEPPPGGPAA